MIELLHENFFEDDSSTCINGTSYSTGLMNACEDAIKNEKIDYQRGGTYVVMEGPWLSSLAESIYIDPGKQM